MTSSTFFRWQAGLVLGVGLGIVLSRLFMAQPANAPKAPPVGLPKTSGFQTRSSSDGAIPGPADSGAPGAQRPRNPLAIGRMGPLDSFLAGREAPAMASVERLYVEKFAELGVDGAAAAQLIDSLQKVQATKLRMQYFADLHAHNVMDYRNQAKALLGDNYLAYAEWESATPARIEAQAIANFAEGSNRPVAGPDQEALVALIAQSQAYSHRTLWRLDSVHPFEEIKLPFLESATEGAVRLDGELSALGSQATRLLGLAADSGFQPDSVTILKRYYDDQMTALSDQIHDLRNPARLALRGLEQEMATVRRNEPEGSPRLIELQTRGEQLRVAAQGRDKEMQTP